MVLSSEEVAKHNKKDDLWVIIHEKAYDLTDFVDNHPGGSAIILKYAGKDATKAFDPFHPGDILSKYLKPEYHKGEVEMKKKNKKVQDKAESLAKSSGDQTAQGNKNANANANTNGSNVVDEFDVEYDEQDDKQPIPTQTASEEVDDEYDEYDDDDDDPPTPEEIQRRKNVKNKPDLSQIYNLSDFEFVARHTMEKTAWAYYSSGCDDEITLRENHLSFQRVFFRPKVMIDVSKIDLSTSMLGTNVSYPFYITATALGKLGHPDGEKVLTRSAAKENVIQMIPTLASCSFDEIVDQATDKQTQWFQLYVNSDREITKKLVQHAESRGIKGLIITVDAPQLGRREKDMRSKNVEDLSYVQGDDDDADRTQGAARAISSFIDASLSWKDLKWFKSITKMPIVLKGIQRVEDAILAAEYGCQGVILSNHGGRQLEYSAPPIEILMELMPILKEKGLNKNFEVYIDGGVSRATDILKALCLGAKGVGIGRKFLYAMSTYGDEGVLKAISILRDELIMNMRFLGATSIDQLNESFVDIRSFTNRFVPEDKLFTKVYQPMDHPAFKDSKL
ncbi:unnamed protein product [Candida verbasci]|uniref:L-lactate dehydrogenase (cytochrome) n=1 Tax=Candida verbasci TaxID=1227364 RepID=A0A9W4TU88_9ASCO|nr:unnamed protein product [Candida verbasci]